MDAFAERVDDRFDRMVAVLTSCFRALDQKLDRTSAALNAKPAAAFDPKSINCPQV